MDTKELQEEFSKDFYQPDYFSQFKINGKKKKADISVIIPTYNRCPFAKDSENYKYNPLYLCIISILRQKLPVAEIVVVDDASTDYTKEVVDDLEIQASSKKGVKIKYLKNESQKGSSTSRNIGAKLAGSKYLFFLDDDCVSAPYLTFTAMLVMKKLEKSDRNFSVLVLPVYDRSSFPKAILPIADLTKTFIKRGNSSASFNSVPEEYITSKNRFLNRTLKIFKPIEVYQTWGHFIIDRSKYLDVGGFPDFATWPNKIGEEQEFACRLIENSYSLYYLPDPKASSYHGAYGARIGDFTGRDWLADESGGEYSLIKFSELCENGIRSGNRVSAREYIYSKIIACFCILYKRNIKEAINWAQHTYKSFVQDNEQRWYPAYARGEEFLRETRDRIWHDAITDGLLLLEETEQKRLNKIEGFIISLKKKGQLEEYNKKHWLPILLKRLLK